MNRLPHDSSAGSVGFHLDKANGKLMGVVAGLADSFGGDPLVWRLVFVLGTVFGFGSFVVLYLAIGLLAD